MDGDAEGSVIPQVVKKDGMWVVDDLAEPPTPEQLSKLSDWFDKIKLHGTVEIISLPYIPYEELPEWMRNLTVTKVMMSNRPANYKHPSDEPGFGAKQDQPVWYMSHPLAPDEHYTYDQNMDHIVHLIRIFWEEGFRVVAPYHTICLAITDDDMKYRVAGLEADMNMCQKMGYVFLTGHRMSRGMELEAKASMSCKTGGIIRNLIGYSDDELREALRFMENGGRLEEDRPASV